MSYLIAISISFSLLLAFVLLSWFETSKGVRLFARPRRALDRQVNRASYVIEHIDWAAFLRHVVRTSLERTAHDIVHGFLVVVRALERTLTRFIRVLRQRVASNVPTGEPVEGSQLIATIVRFRKNLRRERPRPYTVGENEK